MSEHESAFKLNPGTVVTYDSERANRWCREGMAIVSEHGRLIDTYWESFGSDNHVLTDAEVATARIVFDLADYVELTHATAYTWKNYHPDERREITSQHGLRRRLFVAKSALPHLGTQIANARERVEEEGRNLRSAENSLRWAREDLARLEAQA